MWIKVNNTTLEVIATCINEISAEAGYSIFELDDTDIPEGILNPDYGFAQYQFIEDGYGSGTFREYSAETIDDMCECCCDDMNISEMFFQADGCDHDCGYWKTKEVTASGMGLFSFYVPFNMVSIQQIKLVGISNVTGNKSIELYSQYAGIGDDKDTNEESDLAKTFDLISEQFFELDISSVFTNIAAGEHGTIQIAHKAVGGSLYYRGIKVKYQY